MDVLILMWDFHSVCFCFPLLTRTLHLFGVLETGSHCISGLLGTHDPLVSIWIVGIFGMVDGIAVCNNLSA